MKKEVYLVFLVTLFPKGTTSRVSQSFFVVEIFLSQVVDIKLKPREEDHRLVGGELPDFVYWFSFHLYSTLYIRFKLKLF